MQEELVAGDIVTFIRPSQVPLPGTSQAAFFDGDSEYLVRNFVDFESTLDSSVGHSVDLRLFRKGERVVAGPFPVEDLFALSPTSFLECGNSVFHSISYVTARKFQLPLNCGVYSSESGFVFGPSVPDEAVLTDVAEKPVRTLEDIHIYIYIYIHIIYIYTYIYIYICIYTC